MPTDPQSPDQQSMASWLWDNRPWKGFADKQPSMTPLMIALGLLGPRGANNMSARDLIMARELANVGDRAAAEASSFRPATTAASGDGKNVMNVMPVNGEPGQARGYIVGRDDAMNGPFRWMDIDGMNINARNPKAMRPDLRVVPGLLE